MVTLGEWFVGSVYSGDEYSKHGFSIACRFGCLGPSSFCPVRGFRRIVGDEMAPADLDSSAGGLLGRRDRTFRLDLSLDAPRKLAPAQGRRKELSV